MLVRSRRDILRVPIQRFFSASTRSSDARPSTAPKQIPDLKSIRLSPEIYEQNAILRKYDKHQHSPRRIVELAAKSSEINKAAVQPRREVKKLERELAGLKAKKDEDGATKTLALIAPLRTQINEFEQQQQQHDEESRSLALGLPNLTSADTPTNGDHRLIQYLNYNENQSPSLGKADHSTIGQELGIIDFTSASAASGWGFYYLVDQGALLEQALIQYAQSVAARYGWRMVTPPSLVYSHIADSCGFQPRDANDEQQIWQISQSEKDVGKPRRSLAATAEIPLAALYASKDIPQDSLPVKLVGCSRCYRAEAGARGVDTKGLYRVHEFTKVEMFAWTDTVSGGGPHEWLKHSTNVFDEMVNIQTEILSTLGLPCRVLEMPSTDLGASAYRKIDIEALFPSRMSRDEGWGEVTSVSICTDYQSRRLDTRIKDKDGSKSRFPHTINGTALAVPRVLAAVLEHGWRESEGIVTIPKVLQPFMGGMDKIGPK